MQKFVYEYATKVYFGEGAAREHLAEAVSGYGKNVMLAYGRRFRKEKRNLRRAEDDPGERGQDRDIFLRHHVESYLREGAGGRKTGKGAED